jgi:D-alanyl-lipoteichoic acid acyltransferase DltB (MBOAT superfamily)
MIFHSIDFLVFFIVVLAVYWRLPHRGQQLWLLGSSYLFYGYIHPWFLIPLVASTIVDYWSARWMEDHPARRKLGLVLTLTGNLGLLGVFKYFNFFVDNVHAVLTAAGIRVDRPMLAIVLPAGISFYTFQTLTYTIDVYRGTLRARRSFIDIALFVTFFPQLLAGPIERAKTLLPQIENPRTFDWGRARGGLLMIVWGFFQKLVVADNVGVIANKAFSVEDPGFDVLWAGVFAFGIQIYADFAAYSNIARGCARWLGFELMRNFNHPYFARNPVDLWRRWHISLSSWFRDYVYVPLGGNRGSALHQFRNVLVTFLLSGIWHGASWNFMFWGLYHGLLVAGWRFAEPFMRSPVWRTRPVLAIQTLLTYLFTTFGWLLFRETNVEYLRRALSLSPWASTPLQRQVGGYIFLAALMYSVPLWIESAAAEWHGAPSSSSRTVSVSSGGQVYKEAALAALLLSGILLLRSRTSMDFIYFQF